VARLEQPRPVYAQHLRSSSVHVGKMPPQNPVVAWRRRFVDRSIDLTQTQSLRDRIPLDGNVMRTGAN
jgi:hypothetical protein